ncbi:MAG: hypothetical protein MZW92_09860, partial [Comamonadaceae bacterium]|nr:hypothetical protein [Comamonadaceae bacterium]
MVIPTGVDKVAINYNKPDMQELDVQTITKAKKYHAEGQFQVLKESCRCLCVNLSKPINQRL